MVRGTTEYHFNESTYRVEILPDKRKPPFNDGFTIPVKLLEPLSRVTPKGVITFPVGSVLYVGHWQVKKGRMEREANKK